MEIDFDKHDLDYYMESFSGSKEPNGNYTEILKLNELLSKTEIPYTIDRRFDGWQIIYFYNGERIADAVQHIGTYGADENLLEIMGCLTPEEEEQDRVLGFLTAEEVFKRFSKDFLNRKFGEKKEGD